MVRPALPGMPVHPFRKLHCIPRIRPSNRISRINMYIPFGLFRSQQGEGGIFPTLRSGNGINMAEDAANVIGDHVV